MFSSLLVANRAEIACRIFRTARAMGMRCIGVHSEVDAKAKHVREADESVLIGPAAAADSYLRGDRIIDAAKRTGAAAIHPGYGFLAENPDFAEAVIAAGLIWVGPAPASIRAMGLKDEAKRIAEEAGVPVVPGYRGETQDAKTLAKAAREVGFPVLIKAVAGGGGRGIREVHAAGQFNDALASARRESAAAFGDDRVLIEKLIERPRHIEVQVFGDRHGNLVHMFERDCSLQRRRQKVIEEAPAPGMTDEVRAAMTDAALKVARAVNYENAGTVEFIVDGSGPLRTDGFWFMEMNTRLQVEHPVTEAVTGIDLVEWQLRVAAGEKLALSQDEISLHGCAVEARICAEDPGEDFRPSLGRIGRFDTPLNEREHWRLDAGFDPGDLVPPHYDSLLAKAVCAGMERAEAVGGLSGHLDSITLSGLTANIGFLARCLSDPDFVESRLHTGLIAEKLRDLTNVEGVAHVAAGCLALSQLVSGAAGAFDRRDGFRMNAPPRLRWSFATEREAIEVSLERGGRSNHWRVICNGRRHDYSECRIGSRGVFAIVDGQDIWARIEKDAGRNTLVIIRGEPTIFLDQVFDLVAADAGHELRAPLPGKVVAIGASPGLAVKKGDPLVTLEAMKMEHALKAPRDGVIAEIAVETGAQVKEGALLVRLEEEAE